MTNENEIMIKKISIKSNNSQMFEILDVKNSVERILTKFVIDNIITFSSISENLSSDFEKFLK